LSGSDFCTLSIEQAESQSRHSGGEGIVVEGQPSWWLVEQAVTRLASNDA